MSTIGRISAVVVIAATVIGGACGGGTFGGPAPISDFPRKSLTVRHDGSGDFIATLDFDDIPWCDLLEADAFARLNGRSVPLFRGQVNVIPPQNDDGQVDCIHPSVTLDQIPSNLSPPWTIEIGDSSETVSATFAPKPFTPVTLADPVLDPSSDTLTVMLQRQPGDTTTISGTATLTASDGQSTFGFAQAGESEIVFPTFTKGWPRGPVTVAIVLDYFSLDELLDCQAPQCTLTPGSGVFDPPTMSMFTVAL